MERMRALSAQYPRYGYRRIMIFLNGDGHAMSPGRAWRLWRLAQLQVPRKRGRKRVASRRPRPLAPTAANQVWAMTSCSDRCANGQQLECLPGPTSSPSKVWPSTLMRAFARHG